MILIGRQSFKDIERVNEVRKSLVLFEKKEHGDRDQSAQKHAAEDVTGIMDTQIYPGKRDENRYRKTDHGPPLSEDKKYKEEGGHRIGGVAGWKAKVATATDDGSDVR